MRFARGWLWVVAIVLLCTSAVAEVGADGEVRVLVYINPRIQKSVVDQAGIEVVRIFRAAGIDLRWVNCSVRNARNDCRNLLDSDKLIVNVLPRGKSAGESVYGDAFLGEDGTGKYADVFFDRISQAHRDDGIDEARLLGAVAAHEVGHLLLGLRAHTLWGIMAPRWSNESLRQVGMGRLLFTPEQAARMRGKVRGYSAANTYIEASDSSLVKTENFPADRSYMSARCLRLAPSYDYAGYDRLAMQP